MTTHGDENPRRCDKPGCQGDHLPGRCSGHASDGSGRACRAYPIRGAGVCTSHGASAPQVKRAAQHRILAAADSVAAALVKIALDPKEPTAARVTAARDLLDRADLGATRKIDVRSDLSDAEALAKAQQLVADEVAAQREKKTGRAS